MPRRVARTDPPPPAAPEQQLGAQDLDAEQPALAPTADPADPDLEPADADLRDEDDGPKRDLTNGDLARIFHEIGDMLEVKGELRFKTVAYHRAADAIGRSPIDLVAAYRDGADVPKIPGVGAAISDKITELATTGTMRYYEKLIAEVPPSLVELLRIPGLGPKGVRQIWLELGILSMADLRTAAEGGKIRELRGLSERTEQLILEGIQRLETTPRRMHLHRAEATILGLIEALTDTPGVTSIESAGSFRRKKESIGDLDLLAETDDGPGLIERFVGLGLTDQVLNWGSYKAAVRMLRGPQVDLMVMLPGAAGTYRIHFTGSKEHNVRLRERARDMGWSLSEKGFQRIGEDGEPVTGDDAELRTFATEEEAYAFLGLPYIEPELREDEGEIEAALAGRLPDLISLDDLQGDLHSHSDWSDGTHTIEVMAEAARRRGHAYQVLTDHSQSLAIARGLTPDQVEEQRAIIADLNARYAREEKDGTAPTETPKEGFRLLHGCELEIRADGELDYPDELLARFDVVVASVHVSRRQSKAELTRRTLNGIRNPHVDVIAHPSGRMIGSRDDLDLDWDVIYSEAARTGTILEMNGSPHRLDLAVERARRAIGMGVTVSIDSDAHKIAEFDHLRWGLTQARRAWVEPKDVINTRSRADLLEWVAGKPDRV